MVLVPAVHGSEPSMAINAWKLSGSGIFKPMRPVFQINPYIVPFVNRASQPNIRRCSTCGTFSDASSKKSRRYWNRLTVNESPPFWTIGRASIHRPDESRICVLIYDFCLSRMQVSMELNAS